MTPIRLLRFISLASVFYATALYADTPKVAIEMGQAAEAFIKGLNPEQRQTATTSFEADERFNWGYSPRSSKGIDLQMLSPEQRKQALALIESSLSDRGYLEATTILMLERNLDHLKGQIEDSPPESYFVTLFGTPNDPKAWGWRVEGYHLSLNFTIVDRSHVSVTPTAFGTMQNDLHRKQVKGGIKLKAEEDLGRQLVKSLKAEQLKQAIYSDKPSKNETRSQRTARELNPPGLKASEMTAEQQLLLRKLIETYLRRYRPEIADVSLAAIDKDGPESLHFGWAGSTESEKPHAYRIQGKTFLLEYDNIDTDIRHVHTIWRDRANDFGEDLLHEHYRNSPHHKND